MPTLPVPIFIVIDPALPPTALPVVKLNPPLSPVCLLPSPVEYVNPPLVPAVPASGVLNVNDPLDVDFEYPVAISILPPLPVNASPAFTFIDPPSSSVADPNDDPAVTVIEPPLLLPPSLA